MPLLVHASLFITMCLLLSDVNECLENGGSGPCEDECENNVGSYRCRCNRPGYAVDEDNPHACYRKITWWRHEMEIFSVLLLFMRRIHRWPVTPPPPPPTHTHTHTQRPVRRSSEVFFDLRLKQTFQWTIETPVICDAIALIMTLLYWTNSFHIPFTNMV